MFDKILVAIDGSEHSDHALDLAMGLAGRCEATLILLHGIAAPAARSAYEGRVGETAREVYKRVGQELADELLGAARRRVEAAGIGNVETRAVEGDPARVIVETAEHEGAGLIVVGTRGLTGLKGLAMGSVAHKVSNSAGCPVMIVR